MCQTDHVDNAWIISIICFLEQFLVFLLLINSTLNVKKTSDRTRNVQINSQTFISLQKIKKVQAKINIDLFILSINLLNTYFKCKTAVSYYVIEERVIRVKTKSKYLWFFVCRSGVFISKNQRDSISLFHCSFQIN